MAFMTLPDHALREDRAPILAYNAKAGRLFLMDRTQDAAGEWATIKTDITMSLVAFAVDFGRIETGWIHFAGGPPLWAMSFYGQPMPAQPISPGINSAGKALRFKAGFRVPVLSQAIGGLREFAANAGATINGMNELHTQYEEAPEARAGKIPLVKMTDVQELRAGQSTNFQPVFTVLRWVDRPADILGPRMVPPPGAPVAAPRTLPASLQPGTPPARPAAPVRPALPAYDAPPDSWDDTRWDTQVPPRVPAPADVSTAGWASEEIPF